MTMDGIGKSKKELYYPQPKSSQYGTIEQKKAN
jgi:hypothetical protein